VRISELVMNSKLSNGGIILTACHNKIILEQVRLGLGG
jgi:hypothetical protein